MRKLTGAGFVSLDGVIQAPGGPTEDPTGGFDQGGWVFGVGDDVIDPVIGGLFAPPYALLLGRARTTSSQPIGRSSQARWPGWARR